MKAKKFVYSKAFDGEPHLDNFRLEDEELPELKPGEVLFEALCYSVDPYIRIFMPSFPVGSTMIGSQVAIVTKTKNGCYPLGTRIVGYFGWRTHTVTNPDAERQPEEMMKPMPTHDLGKLPISLALGAAGMPGNTAYLAFLKACQPKEGEVVVVSGAAGAVGSLVAQLAKMKGCKVVGVAGSEEKVTWLLQELKVDFAFNYKTDNLKQKLKEAVPEGIDCYFDNVGGAISNTIIQQMKDAGRILVCGSISDYNEKKQPSMPKDVKVYMASKNIRTIDFEIFKATEEDWNEGIHQMLKWLKEGKLKYHETVRTGFDNLPEAFLGMLKGENVGKMVVMA